MYESWIDEIDLDPASHWLKLGTRALGSRPWLIVDSKAEVELAERARLLADHRGEVLLLSDAAAVAGREVLELVVAETGLTSADQNPTGEPLDPLEQAGRLVQEDLVLMQWRDGAWRLDAACLCFPSLWRLADKAGKPMLAIHEPVAGYPDAIGDTVNRMMSRLGQRPVWRRNWFVHGSPALFQPERTPEPVVPLERCGTDLFVRSERQTLRLLPESGWILFTIRIQHCQLRDLLAVRGAEFVAYLEGSTAADVAHRGMSPDQAAILRRL